MARETPSPRGRPMPGPVSEAIAVEHDPELVQALRAGDERAFLDLVGRLHTGMVRFARGFVNSDAGAEDVVQDTWAAVLDGIDRFEGRSALRSWIYGILANLARTRAVRDARSVPMSALEPDDAEPAVDPSEFLPKTHPRWAGHWANYPAPWPEDQLISEETLMVIRDAITRLPSGQRGVMQLRDVEGWTSQEVCEALSLSEVNQRVLLHRAR